MGDADLQPVNDFRWGGAQAFAGVIAQSWPGSKILPDLPPLAPAVGELAELVSRTGGPLTPDAIRPIYVRRSDVELVRDRRAAAAGIPKP